MKKLIGLTLLTAALFADSYVEPTPSTQPEENPKDQTPIDESSVNEPSTDKIDQTSIDESDADEASADASINQDPIDESSVNESSVDDPIDQAPTDGSSVNESSAETPSDQELIDESYAQESVVEAPVQMCCIPPDPYGSDILAEFKMGSFRFGDKKLRHQYDEGLLDLQLSSTVRVWKPLYAYMSLEYIGADGRLKGSHQKIKIRMVPLSLGVRYLQKVTYDLKYYLTAGPRYFFVHQWTKHTSQTPNGFGGFVNTGFIYYIDHNFVIDLFGEYSFKKMHLRPLHGNHQVGGLTLGAGIGYFW